MNYLMDTCVVSELIKPQPAASVAEWVASLPEDRLFLSVLTLGEIHKGISRLEDGARKEKLTRWLDVDLRARFEDRLLALDADVLLEWGRLCGAAEQKGRTLPVLDALMAATAIVHHMTLVTRNEEDGQLPGVLLFNPWGPPTPAH